MSIKSETVMKMVIHFGGKVIEDRPKFIRFETSAGEVIYNHTDESLELNGDFITFPDLETQLNDPY